MKLTRVWNLVGVVVVPLILLLGYVVGVAPALTSAADSDAEIASVEAQNQVKSAELAALRALDEDSVQLFAELEELQFAVPAIHDTSVFANRIDELATAAGIAFVEVSYVTAVDAVSPVAASETPTETPGEADERETEQPAPEAAGDSSQAVPSVPGLISLGVNIRVSGSPAAVNQFLASVQLDKRAFSISSIDLATDSETGVSELGLIGAIYVMTSNTAPLAEAPVSDGELN